MDRKPYVILVASQKGGVGKTTIAINLACALLYQDYKVLLVDADTATISVSEHLGLNPEGIGYKEIVSGNVSITDSIFVYQPLDLHIILSTSATDLFEPKPEDLSRFYSQLAKLDYDFIVVDNPPGFFNGIIAKYINDVAIVTTPDLPAAASSARISNYCEKYKVRHRLVINRTGYTKFELDREQVEKLFGDVAYALLPEDKIIPESIAKHTPAFVIDRGSPFSAAIEEFSRAYMLKVGEPTIQQQGGVKAKRLGFFGKLAGWTTKGKEK